MKIRFSCVVDQDPKFGRQAFVWALSLLTYGGGETDSLVIHTVGEYCGEYRKFFDDWGIETRVVTAFDLRHPNSNKLSQLESDVLQSSDYVVLCDCDIAFCSDISGWIAGESIRARAASAGGLRAHQWIKVFNEAKLAVPANWCEAVVTRAAIPANYVNGGLYVIPRFLFLQLREVWPRWNQWLLDRRRLIHPYTEFADQISFAMSCEELGLTIDKLPVEINLDTVYLPAALTIEPTESSIRPLVLHYHRLSKKGYVRPTSVPCIDRQVRRTNDLIRLAEQVNYDKSSVMLLGKGRIP